MKNLVSIERYKIEIKMEQSLLYFELSYFPLPIITSYSVHRSIDAKISPNISKDAEKQREMASR